MLVGDGPSRADACETARELGLGARVRFLGERDALPELLAPADVFLLSSSEESFGLSALEAMSCGVPVVATDIPGYREVVRDGVDGLLVRPNDPIALAGALRRVLSEPELASALAEAGRARAGDFSWDAVVPRLEAVYDGARTGIR